MATSYQEFIDMALEMIRENGMAVTFRKSVAGDPIDPSKPWLPTENVDTDKTVYMAFLPEETINYYTSVRILRTADSESFEYGLLANNNCKPELDDVIIRNGDLLRVRYVLAYAPDGTDIFYIVGIKS